MINEDKEKILKWHKGSEIRMKDTPETNIKLKKKNGRTVRPSSIMPAPPLAATRCTVREARGTEKR